MADIGFLSGFRTQTYQQIPLHSDEDILPIRTRKDVFMCFENYY